MYKQLAKHVQATDQNVRVSDKNERASNIQKIDVQ